MPEEEDDGNYKCGANKVQQGGDTGIARKLHQLEDDPTCKEAGSCHNKVCHPVGSK